MYCTELTEADHIRLHLVSRRNNATNRRRRRRSSLTVDVLLVVDTDVDGDHVIIGVLRRLLDHPVRNTSERRVKISYRSMSHFDVT